MRHPSPAPNAIKKRQGARVKLLAQFIISAICLAVILRNVELSELSQAFSRVRALPVVIVFAIMPFAIAVRAIRWKYMLAVKDVPVPFWMTYRVTFIGLALNLLIPGGLGDVARSYDGWRSHGNKEAMLRPRCRTRWSAC